MRRLWRRLAFAFAILGSTHAYIWARFVAAPDLPEPWFAVATIALCLLAPSLPMGAIAMRRLPRDRAAPILKLTYGWFACAVYLFLAAAITHLVCAVAPVSPRVAALAGIAAAVVVVVYGYANVARGPVVRRVSVPLANLPASANGYTIVQLTDVHIGTTIGADFAAKVVARVNALEPDLIVLTGDIVDGRLSELAPHVAPFREFRARDGVYAVTGNHEYYWNAEPWLAHLGSLGFRYLRNEHVTIRGAFQLAGVDDTTSRTEDIPGALAGRDPALPVVLLAHHPHVIGRAAAAGADLQLSGHTHGGQLLPLGWLIRLFEPQAAGLARVAGAWLYVGEGTGYWGPAMRVGTVCEISAITLVRA